MSVFNISTWAFIIIIIIISYKGYYIRLYITIVVKCWCMHGKRENEQTVVGTKRSTFSTVRTAPCSSPEMGPNSPRPPLYDTYSYVIWRILLYHVYYCAWYIVYTHWHNYYYYSYRGGSVFEIVLNSISSVYGQQITTITI